MTGRTSYLTCALAILVAATLLLAGCGTKSEGNPGEMLDAAAQASRDAGSAHAQMSVALSPLDVKAHAGLSLQGRGRHGP